MIAVDALALSVLYEQDETAWLEAMSMLASQGRLGEMDIRNLSGYLADMAKRDRREVVSRLVVLMAHLLKSEHQSERRSGSWRRSIMEQRRELRGLLESGTLFNHAARALGDAYMSAKKEAAAETELAVDSFPAECPWDIESLLEDDGDN